MSPRLIPLTDIAQQAVAASHVMIERFPFRVGRKRGSVATQVSNLVNRLTQSESRTDLLLVDNGKCRYVSGAHFMIETEGQSYLLTDLGSQCGTIVEGSRIGGNRRGGRVQIHDHDVIIVGSAKSPFVFKFRISGG